MTSDDQRPPDTDAYPEGDDAVSELESAEQYVRAHDLIESLRADRRPPRESGLEEDARLSATAALLHAASPDGGNVDPLFAARLFARLEAEQERQASTSAQAAVEIPSQSETPAVPAPAAATAAPPQEASSSPRETPAPPRRLGVSRRGVLLGGLGAAAAAFAGAAVTTALNDPSREAPHIPPTSALVPEGTGTWVAIALVDAMPVGAVQRFEAGAVVGYLRHTASGFLALSGVCTHMACLLQWNGGEQTFDCPCHGGRFLASGKAAPGAPYTYPPLPTINTKVEAGHVWVYVTGGSENAEFPSSQGTATVGGYGAGATQPSK